MTTRNAPRFTADVFTRGGEVFLPLPKDGHQTPGIAAVSFVRQVTDDLRATRRACLADALRAPQLANARLLLGASHPEPDGVRIRTMSKLKDPRLKNAFFGRDWLELLIVGAEGLKWVADFPVDLSSLDVIESLMFEEFYSVIVGGSSAAVVHHFLQHGWSRPGKLPRDAAIDADFVRDTVLIGQRADLVALRLFGAFDDREVSADIIGAASTIEQLWAALREPK